MSLIEHLDLAFISLYVFWFAFALLILYLRNEDRREGYPLVYEGRGGLEVTFPRAGTPLKVFNLRHAGPSIPVREERPLAGLLNAFSTTPGSPYQAMGNPLEDGVGTASYVLRSDVPDVTFDESAPRIVPLRVATDYHVAEEDPDIRGWTVVTAEGQAVGTVVDLWVDRSDVILRYIEAECEGLTGARRVVFPIGNGAFERKRRIVKVNALLAEQFLAAPTIANPDQITLREEDRISGYFAGGYLYATPNRSEPLL